MILICLLRSFLLGVFYLFISFKLLEIQLVHLGIFPERWYIRLLLLAQLGSLSLGIGVPIVKADSMNLTMGLDDALHDLKHTLISSHQNSKEIVISDRRITKFKLDSNPPILR